VEAEFYAVWSVRLTSVDGTQESIGSGKRNTQLIVEKFKQISGEWDTAAQKANELVFNKFDDWFLPSKGELDQMYGNLKRKNLGDFTRWYWSSSMSSSYSAYCQDFTDGKMDTDSTNYTSSNYPRGFKVRPIRQF